MQQLIKEYTIKRTAGGQHELIKVQAYPICAIVFFREHKFTTFEITVFDNKDEAFKYAKQLKSPNNYDPYDECDATESDIY